MTATTPINGYKYLEPLSGADLALATKQLADGMDTRSVPRFITTAAREAAITAPVDGQICILTPAGEMPQTLVYALGGWQGRAFREQRASAPLTVPSAAWTVVTGWGNDTTMSVGAGITADVGGFLAQPGVYTLNAMFTWSAGTAVPRLVMGLGFSQAAPPDDYHQSGSTASAGIQYSEYITVVRVTALTRFAMFASQDSGASRSILARRFSISRGAF